MKTLISFLLFALLSCASLHVDAYCSTPSMYSDPPTPPGAYGSPSAPMCLSGYQLFGEHDCSEWELNNYIDEVNEYIRKLYNFAQEAQRFADDAAMFADEALAYAECESQEAKEPLN